MRFSAKRERGLLLLWKTFINCWEMELPTEEECIINTKVQFYPKIQQIMEFNN